MKAQIVITVDISEFVLKPEQQTESHIIETIKTDMGKILNESVIEFDSIDVKI